MLANSPDISRIPVSMSYGCPPPSHVPPRPGSPSLCLSLGMLPCTLARFKLTHRQHSPTMSALVNSSERTHVGMSAPSRCSILSSLAKMRDGLSTPPSIMIASWVSLASSTCCIWKRNLKSGGYHSSSSRGVGCGSSTPASAVNSPPEHIPIYPKPSRNLPVKAHEQRG